MNKSKTMYTPGPWKKEGLSVKAGQRGTIWYCPYCDEYLEGEEVTFEETHDPRKNGCGNPVQAPPDPPYDHTGHDTLEEKRL